MAKKRKKKFKDREPSMSQRVRATKFHTFQECVKTVKKAVYMIVRGRKVVIQNQEQFNWTTLGSGFLAAPNRLVTAAHVIDDPDKGPTMKPEPGDIYYFIRHDDEGNWHTTTAPLNVDKEIFLRKDVDLAVIYLPDSFYSNGKQVFADKNDFIRVHQEFLAIGSDIGVLGYPLSKLDFENRDITKPKIGDILLRTDKGVINCRYITAPDQFLYQFTLAFNPGNSGGPIFDVRTGRLVSIVRGFQVVPIGTREIEISEDEKKTFKHYEGQSYIDSFKATYSLGFATPSFISFFRDHNVLT